MKFAGGAVGGKTGVDIELNGPGEFDTDGLGAESKDATVGGPLLRGWV